MGRILSGGAGSSSSGSGLQPINTSVVTGEDIQSGDILTLGADNLAYRAMDPTLPGATLRPMSQAAAILNGAQSPATILTTAAVAVGKCVLAVLPTGNFVVVSLAATTNYPQFTIYTPSGVPVLGPVQIDAVDASTAAAYLKIALLSGGGFAVVYPGANVNVKYAVFDNNGTVVKAGTVIEAVNGLFGATIAPLIDGGFVAGWYCTISGVPQPRIARFNAAGVMQGAVTQVDTLPNLLGGTGEALSIAALSGGGFVVAYTYIATASVSTTCRFARYSAAGLLQGVQTPYGPTGSDGSMAAYVIGLTDGGFMVGQMPPGAGSINPQVAKYDANGVLVGAPFQLNASGAGGASRMGIRAIARAGGGYTVVWYDGSGTVAVRVATFNATAAQVGATVLGTPSTATFPVSLAALSDGGFVAGCAVGNACYFTRFDSAMNVVGPSVVQNTTGVATNQHVAALVNPVQPAAITFIGLTSAPSSAAAFTIYNAMVQRMTLIGVATASAAKGAVVPMQYVGSAAIRPGFNQPYAVNAQGNTVPGQKMSIVGNNAIMQGIQ